MNYNYSAYPHLELKVDRKWNKAYSSLYDMTIHKYRDVNRHSNKVALSFC